MINGTIVITGMKDVSDAYTIEFYGLDGKYYWKPCMEHHLEENVARLVARALASDKSDDIREAINQCGSGTCKIA